MWRYLALVLLLFGTPAGASVQAGENFDYLVSYQGLFSAGASIAIADLNISTQHANGLGEDYFQSELSVSSENHAFSEGLYPMRYRFRSWYARDLSRCLAFERYEKTRRTRHNLYLIDGKQALPSKRDLLQENTSFELQELSTLADQNGLPELFDRLGMLQKVRAELSGPGQLLSVPVSNGRKSMRYAVSVERREQIQLGEQMRPSLKVKFESFKRDEHGTEKASHRPIYFWFSDDAAHFPLRVVSRHALGTFTIELAPPLKPVVQAAGRTTGQRDG